MSEGGLEFKIYICVWSLGLLFALDGRTDGRTDGGGRAALPGGAPVAVRSPKTQTDGRSRGGRSLKPKRTGAPGAALPGRRFRGGSLPSRAARSRRFRAGTGAGAIPKSQKTKALFLKASESIRRGGCCLCLSLAPTWCLSKDSPGVSKAKKT